jgi:hypothetical protein
MTSSRFSGRRIGALATRTAAASALVLGAVGLASAPAQAAVTGFGGAVGVLQTVTVTDVTTSGVGQSTCTVTPTINGVAQPSTSGTLQGTTLTFQWTPANVGAATFSMSDCTTTSIIPAASITQVATTTIISTPNTAPLNQAVRVNITVQSASPSTYTPTGQVVVRNANGAVLSTMGLTPGPGVGQSFAYYWWTPTAAGTFFFVATYNGDSNATTSVSPQDTVIATPSGNTISLSAPATMTQGVPVQLTATVFPSGTQGSVGFTVNGQPISASVPLNAQGQASFTWTPTAAGQIALGASYMTNQGGSGSTSERVTVVAGAAAKDTISLTQPGVGPWNPNGVYTVPNGTTFTFQASTQSGSPVTLSDTGPCQVNGLTLTVDVGSGQCNLVASSPGGPGYAANQQGYTVVASPGTQALTFQPPASSRVNRGRNIRLEANGGSDTNAGQAVNWRAINSGGVCRVTFPANGSVIVRTTGAGTCQIRGIAQAVPGQWNRMVVNYTYRVR